MMRPSGTWPETAALPVITTLRPITVWSATEARPAEHRAVADDRRARDAGMAAEQATGADLDVVATMTRLSILVPSPTAVSAMVPRSMQALEPISTSSPIRTAPSELIRT